MLSQGKTASAATPAKPSSNLWGLLLNLLWIAMLVIGIYYGYGSWKLTTQGSRVSGTVVQMIGSEDDDGSYSYAPVVEYQVNGSTYRYESHSYTSPPAYQEGQRVQLLYDRDHPDKARIGNFLELWLLPVMLIPFALIGAAANYFVMPLLGRRKKAWPRQ